MAARKVRTTKHEVREETKPDGSTVVVRIDESTESEELLVVKETDIMGVIEGKKAKKAA